jgi:hypothetical protein
MPREDAYVSFLQQKKVPIKELKLSSSMQYTELEAINGSGKYADAAAEDDGEEEEEEAGGSSSSSSSDSAMDTSGSSSSTAVTTTDSSISSSSSSSSSASDAAAAAAAAGSEVAVKAVTRRVPDVTGEVKAMALADRDVMEKGQQAYVSAVRAYKEHRLNYIFVFDHFPFAKVAQGMGLLYLPVMADLKHYRIQYRGTQVAPSQIAFKDKKREKQRQQNIVALKDKRVKEQEEREAKQRTYEKQKAQKLKQQPKRRNKRTHQAILQEWEELADENRLMKKLKQGKITKAQFEIAVGERDGGKAAGAGGGDSDDDDDESD